MKKIIVPTDFSPAAANAYAYAREFAAFTDLPLKLVHVCHPGTYIDTTLPPILNDMRSTKERKLEQFANQWNKLETEGTLQTVVEQEVILGFTAEELVKLSKEGDSDFIIMGTTGVKGALHKLLGTVSSVVSQKAHCPVWLIPPDASFKQIRNILYAGNYESANKKMLDAIVEISDIFDSVIHLVHINDQKKKGKDWVFEELLLEQIFQKEVPDFPVQLHTVRSDSIWEGINDYVKKNNIDLIVMVTRHRRFWERLLHRSMSKAMLLHAEVPILIMHT